MVHTLTDYIFLSRIQFALTTMFHIIWPVLTIGLSVYILLAELAWVRTGRAHWYQQARFWSRFFLLAFALGVISGIPLEFQFGTNWSGFSAATGHFLGQILSVEAMSGFLLESIFLYLMVAGWNRLSPRLHLFTTAMITLGAVLSAFWIMVANSWMQTPRGGHMEDGVFRVTDRVQAILNPDLFVSFPHMLLACLTSTAFILGGVAAWHLLHARHTAFYLRVFKVAVAAGLLLALLQAGTGDLSGQSVAKLQPAKLAATEAFWNTNGPGEGAAWSIFAWPDEKNERNVVEFRIPHVLSLLATHDPYGRVIGLKDIPRDERPPIALIFYSFRVMVITGMGLAQGAADTGTGRDPASPADLFHLAGTFFHDLGLDRLDHARSRQAALDSPRHAADHRHGLPPHGAGRGPLARHVPGRGRGPDLAVHRLQPPSAQGGA
jgi:cytochrome d ubiquinol oxidase subunit I